MQNTIDKLPIVRRAINGRQATASYLVLGSDGEFKLVPPEKATVIKVVFDDGGLTFGTLVPKSRGERK
jgi:hypothetical protein